MQLQVASEELSRCDDLQGREHHASAGEEEAERGVAHVPVARQSNAKHDRQDSLDLGGRYGLGVGLGLGLGLGGKSKSKSKSKSSG